MCAEAKQAEEAAKEAAAAKAAEEAAMRAEEQRQADLLRKPATLEDAIEHMVAVRLDAEKKLLSEEYASKEVRCMLIALSGSAFVQNSKADVPDVLQ